MTDVPSIAAALQEDDRLLFAAALAQLADGLDDYPRSPLAGRIASLRSALVAGTVLDDVPGHVSFDEAEYQEFTGFLPVSSWWCVYWEYGDEGDYVLRAEVAVPAGVLVFDLAEGLQGAPGFELECGDAEFAETIRAHAAERAPATSSKLVPRPVELAFSWAAVDSQNPESVSDHVNTLTKGSGIGPFLTRGAFVDEHSNPALAEREYAGLTTMAIGTHDDLEALATALKDTEESLLAPSTPKR